METYWPIHDEYLDILGNSFGGGGGGYGNIVNYPNGVWGYYE